MKIKPNKIAVHVCSLMLILFSAFTLSLGQTTSSTPSDEKKAKKLEPREGWFTLAPNIEVFSVEMPGLTHSITEIQPMGYLYRMPGLFFSMTSNPIYEMDKDLTPEEHIEKTGERWWKIRVERFSKSGRKIDEEKPRSIKLEGHPGREYKMTDGVVIWIIRLYRTDNRLYGLEVNVSVKNKSFAERFLKSFTFKREKPLQFLEDPAPPFKYPLGDPTQKP